MGALLKALVRDSCPAPRHIAEDVGAPHRHVEATQEAVVAHPVGHQLSHPRDALRPDVVTARHADLAGHGLFGMAARRAVLGAGLGVDVGIGGVTLAVHARAPVSLVTVPSPRIPADHVGDIEWPLEHGLYQAADFDILPETSRRAAQFLGFYGVCDMFEFLGGVAVRLAGLVLEAILRLRARHARRAAQCPAHQFAKLVGVEHLTGLDDEALRLAALLFHRLEQARPHGKAVAVTDGLVPLPVGAAVQPLDAAQFRRHHGGIDGVEKATRGQR